MDKGGECVKTLIVEDDYASRVYMLRLLEKYGECDITVNGREAVDAVALSLEDEDPYELICLDIMMPEMDGYTALKEIRKLENEASIPEEKKSKVIMTTALTDGRNVQKAFDLGCIAYAGKPINPQKFENELRKLSLI